MRLFILAFLVYQIIGCECHPSINLSIDQKPVGAYETYMTERRFALGCNELSHRLMSNLEYKTKNLIISPLSICTALGMLAEGARNETKAELMTAFGWSQYWNQEYFKDRFRSLLDEYEAMNTRSENPRNATIEVANMALVSSKSGVKKEYSDDLKEYYKALVNEEDFAASADEIKNKVNNFVDEKTHGLIKQILDKPLSPSTVLFLMNTVYFKGFWEFMFPSTATHKAKFYNHDNSEKEVEMMHKTAHFKHHFDNKRNVTLLELPYRGEVSMIILLPHDKQGLPKALDSISFDELGSLMMKMDSSSVSVHFPKFKYDHKISLKEMLPKVGLSLTFGDSPDLSGIADGVSVSDAVHKAVIETFEAGTKAAAVTAITVTRISAINPKNSMVVCDHPFAFVIRDMKSSINLFTGVVNEM